MSEFLRSKNIVAAGVVLSLGFLGLGEAVDYYAERAGRQAGEAAREEIEEVDIAGEQWNEIKALLADEDLRDLLVENLREDGIDDPMDVIEALGEQ